MARPLPAGLGAGNPCALLEVPVVSDHADPQIGHLLGLTLSRAAALRSLADAPCPTGRSTPAWTRRPRHISRQACPRWERGDFTTDHWLATFAALALDPVTAVAARP